MKFVRSPVIEVFETLEQSYKVNVRLKNVRIENQTISAAQGKTQTIMEILSALCLTLSWHYESFISELKIVVKEL